MTLAALQSAFQQAILAEDAVDDILPAIAPSQRLDSMARFAIYHDAYRARLAEFLSNDYPVLRAVLGDEAFGEIVMAYMAATPSLHCNARWYGQGLPAFLRGTPPWQDAQAIGDLAIFECALATAFDAPDSDAQDATALARFDTQEHPHLYFGFAASVKQLTLLQGIVAAYEAVLADEEAAVPATEGEETILIWRDRALDPLYRPLDADEALAISAAISGATLEEICGLLALRMSADDAAAMAGTFIAGWFGDGLVNAVRSR